MSAVPTIHRPERHGSLSPLRPLAPTDGVGTVEPLDADFLAELVAGLAAAEGLWRAHAVHDPEQRGSVRLVATEAYEVWLLGWTIGQGVELHDHGGSTAALHVVEGELLEVRSEASGRPSHHRLACGEGRVVPAGTVHDVLNVSVAAATSLHAYSPPLSSMTFYDPITGAPTRSEPVAPEPAVVSGAVAARALHPAAGVVGGPVPG